MQILVIRSWIRDVEPIAAALRPLGVDHELARIDHEPALNAALVHVRFDVAIVDTREPALRRETIEACFRANARAIPIVELDDLDSLADRVRAALRATTN